MSEYNETVISSLSHFQRRCHDFLSRKKLFQKNYKNIRNITKNMMLNIDLYYKKDYINYTKYNTKNNPLNGWYNTEDPQNAESRLANPAHTEASWDHKIQKWVVTDDFKTEPDSPGGQAPWKLQGIHLSFHPPTNIILDNANTEYDTNYFESNSVVNQKFPQFARFPCYCML